MSVPSPLLDVTYARCLRVADLLRRRWVLTLCLGLPLFVVAALAINRLVLHDFPNSGDEYVYLYQAATMAAGRLWNRASPSPDAFWFTYIEQAGGRSYGTFPFGWPVVLALALALHLPVSLVNPLLGAATVLLAGVLGRQLYGARAGVWAALVVGTMPFVLFNAASYFSHTFCGVLLLGAACLAARDQRRPRHTLAIGFLLAWAVLARYYTGVLCGIPIVFLLLRRSSSVPLTATPTYLRVAISSLVMVMLGGVPGMVALGVYNKAMTGSPWHLTTQAGTFDHWFKSGFVSRGADILSSHVARHLLWTPPALIALYVVYLWRVPRSRRTPLDWMLALTALTLFFYYERGGNQYGARFHYEAFLFATVFVCGQIFQRDSLAGAPSRDRRAFAAFAVSLLVVPGQFLLHAMLEARVVTERMDPFTAVARAGVHDAVVFIDGRVGTARTMLARDLTRNGLTYEAPVLYAIDAGAPADCAVMALLPGRSAYRYVWNAERRQGELTRIRCGDASHP
jgi:hypothetical protein